MSYSKLILRDSAEIVWPLDDINNESTISSAIHFFGNSELYSASININSTNLMSNPIVFGGGTLLSFTSSAVGLSIPLLDRFSEIYDNKYSTISFWFQINSLSPIESPIFKKRGNDNIGLFIKNNYLMFRCGTSASYNEVAVDFANVKDPHHIILSRSRSGLSIILDGITYTNNDGSIVGLEKDNNHSSNNYLDFYGPVEGSWNIDTPALYPNSLNESVAKRHYVYGLGKNIPDKIFYSRGGNLYNFSTVYSERLIDINWDYPDEWQFSEIVDLNVNEFGVGPLRLNGPSTYSFDNKIDKTGNKYKFSSSAGNTQASYIDINNLRSKIGEGQYPFLVKFKLDGQLPPKYTSQRLITLGEYGEEEIIYFDLYNDDDVYKIKINAINFSEPVEFNISNVSSSPSFYLGMNFNSFTNLYFSEDGQPIQTASFNYFSASVFGTDPMVGYFPTFPGIIIRLASSLNYTDSSFNNNVYGVEQFLGSFERFLVAQEDFSASSNFQYIDDYNKSRYEFVYDSSLNRFRVKNYGRASFNIHSVNFSEYIDDDTQILGANYIGVGYPSVESSSSIYFYATLMSYSGSVINPQVRLSENNYLPFLNNINVNDMYLKFDIEIYSDDSIFYPPRIKYFRMQTLKSTNNTAVLKDDAGPSFTLYPSSSSVYLPEIRYTPSIYMTEESGIKIYNTYSDFTENILSRPLDPRTIEGLKVWLDARFIEGLNKINPEDDSRVLIWKDLSGNINDAIQNVSASAPIFRSQSLNLLRMNQLDGGELDETDFIITNNATIRTTIEGAVSGTRGIEITPTGSALNSYIDMSFNTASITVFPNQSYTVVGSIKLLKPQTASALHENARKIIVYTTDGVTETLSASSISASNTAGTYSLSATFTTSSSTTGARIYFYNGSFDQFDKVYWDNLGLYPVTSSVYNSWVQPLTIDDRPTIKFDGGSMKLESSASVNQPYSLYVLGRNFNDGSFVSYSSSGGLYASAGFYYVDSGSAVQSASINNEFKIYSILVKSGSARFYVNGEMKFNEFVGNDNINKLTIGYGEGLYLSGDISAVLLFDGYHDYQTRSSIENWLDESFNLPQTIPVLTILDDGYLGQYTNDY